MTKPSKASTNELMNLSDHEGSYFVYTAADLSPVLAVNMGENEDSFLVYMPATPVLLVDEENGSRTLQIDPYCKSPYTRLLKSQFQSVSPLVGSFEGLYIEYLIGEGSQKIPDMYDEVGWRALSDKLEEITLRQEKEKKDKKATKAKKVVPECTEVKPAVELQGFDLTNFSEASKFLIVTSPKTLQ